MLMLPDHPDDKQHHRFGIANIGGTSRPVEGGNSLQNHLNTHNSRLYRMWTELLLLLCCLRGDLQASH
jgi:hypothetical protein